MLSFLLNLQSKHVSYKDVGRVVDDVFVEPQATARYVGIAIWKIGYWLQMHVGN